LVVGDAKGLGAFGFVSPVDGDHEYVIGDPPLFPTDEINCVLDPEQIVFVTELTETVGVGLTVTAVETHPLLKRPPLKFLAL
jgi:hypothetical protein